MTRNQKQNWDNVNFAFLLFILGCLLIAIGTGDTKFAPMFIWTGLNFIALALVHFFHCSNPFHKRSNGTIPFWSVILFFPILMYTWLIWHVIRLFSSERSCDKVTDSLTIGRRLLDSELNDVFINYVDLTSEFFEPQKARKLKGYLHFPILDAGVPDANQLKQIINSLPSGPTYIHCAQGHGRTGLFAAAMLLVSKQAISADAAIKMLQDVRPALELNAKQKRFLKRFSETI